MNSQIALLSSATQIIDRYIVSVVFTIGNIGNLLSIFIFSKKSWRKNVCVFYLKCFILFNTFYINSVMLSGIFIYGFQINAHNSNVILCKLYQYIFFLGISLSPTVLILASIDRLLITSQNVDTRLYSSKRLAYFSLSIGTGFWVLFSIHALIMFEIQESVPSTFVCTILFSRFSSNFATYFYGAMNVVYCVGMIILCSLSFKNVRHIRAVPRGKRTQEIRSMHKKDFQLLRCLFVQDVVYICLSTLFISFYLYNTFSRRPIVTLWDRIFMYFISRLVNMIYSLYFISSFFVFVVVSRAFRQELKRLSYKVIGKEVNQIREEENRPENNPTADLEMNTIPTIVLSA